MTPARYILFFLLLLNVERVEENATDLAWVCEILKKVALVQALQRLIPLPGKLLTNPSRSLLTHATSRTSHMPAST